MVGDLSEPTKARLARVLREAGLVAMADDAERGRYDDYESDSATPCIDLVRRLQAAGRGDLAHRAMQGEWDASKAESDAWAKRQSGEVGRLLDDLRLR